MGSLVHLKPPKKGGKYKELGIQAMRTSSEVKPGSVSETLPKDSLDIFDTIIDDESSLMSHE